MTILPRGISDYKMFIKSGFYYVDKTLLIKELIDMGPGVSLICRPRRFGKTLNLSMLRYFFEKTEESNADLFVDKAIWQDEKYRSLCGHYPVITVTFKDVKQRAWDDAYKQCITLISAECKRHQEYIRANISVVHPHDFEKFERIATEIGDYTDITESFRLLARLLHQITKTPVMILLDEYDAPIHAAYEHGYYKNMVAFIRELLSAVLKDNSDVEHAVLTGILRTAKEGIFSGLNNLSVFTVLHDQFADKFGFVAHEVDTLLKEQNLIIQAEVIKQWYNGYRIGKNILVYNPWSIIECAKNRGTLKPYWINTSNNELIKKLIANSSSEIKTEFEALLTNLPLIKIVDEAFIFPGIEHQSQALWSLLLFSGYVSYSSYELSEEGMYRCSLTIPNKEIAVLYKQLLTVLLQETVNTTPTALLNALQSGNVLQLEKIIQKLFANSISFYDFSPDEPEQTYHLFVLGLLACFSNIYHVRSNRESGSGRYDVMLIPKDTTHSGIIFEFKTADSDDDQTLQTVAHKALKQIKLKGYTQELHAQGINKVIMYAIAFYGKRLVMKAEQLIT